MRWGQTGGYGYVPNPIMPNTFYSVAYDLGDPTSPFGDIHPRYKQQVSARLVNAGLSIAYGEDTYWTGPIANGATNDGNTTIISFTSNGADGLTIVSQNYVAFEVADADGNWWSTTIASWSSDTVTLGYNGPTTAVRYNWQSAPCEPAVGIYLCAVYSIENNLPAPPFVIDVTQV